MLKLSVINGWHFTSHGIGRSGVVSLGVFGGLSFAPAAWGQAKGNGDQRIGAGEDLGLHSLVKGVGRFELHLQVLE